MEGFGRGAQAVKDLGAFIRERRAQAQLSLRKLAELAGVSNPYLSQIERGLRTPSARMLQAIAKALRVSAESLYVQAGFLQDAAGRPETLRAILSDAGLTLRQRQELAEIYERFRIDTAERRSRRRERPLKVSGGVA
jgi:transcriptional regulator with XRE-family HTH domain